MDLANRATWMWLAHLAFQYRIATSNYQFEQYG